LVFEKIKLERTSGGRHEISLRRENSVGKGKTEVLILQSIPKEALGRISKRAWGGGDRAEGRSTSLNFHCQKRTARNGWEPDLVHPTKSFFEHVSAAKMPFLKRHWSSLGRVKS